MNDNGSKGPDIKEVEGGFLITATLDGEQLGTVWAKMDATLAANGASDDQRITMESTFYFGAATVFGLVMGYNGRDKDRSLIDLDALTNIKKDLAAHAKRIDSGAAVAKEMASRPLWMRGQVGNA